MLYQNILSLCEKQKISITQLEKACDLANATIRRWENGNSPSALNLAKVADFFGVSVDFLISRNIYRLSDSAIQYAKNFDALPEEKKKLAAAYLSVVEAQ